MIRDDDAFTPNDIAEQMEDDIIDLPASPEVPAPDAEPSTEVEPVDIPDMDTGGGATEAITIEPDALLELLKVAQCKTCSEPEGTSEEDEESGDEPEGDEPGDGGDEPGDGGDEPEEIEEGKVRGIPDGTGPYGRGMGPGGGRADGSGMDEMDDGEDAPFDAEELDDAEDATEEPPLEPGEEDYSECEDIVDKVVDLAKDGDGTITVSDVAALFPPAEAEEDEAEEDEAEEDEAEEDEEDEAEAEEEVEEEVDEEEEACNEAKTPMESVDELKTPDGKIVTRSSENSLLECVKQIVEGINIRETKNSDAVEFLGDENSFAKHIATINEAVKAAVGSMSKYSRCYPVRGGGRLFYVFK